MEQVIVRMNHHMQMALLGNGPEGGGEMAPVEGVQDLSPHGLLLAALGECTAVLLHSYAARREVALAEVEVRMWWEECTDCSDEGSGKEQVRLELWLSGSLEETDRKRLVSVAKQCPIHRMLHGGVPVLTEIVESPPSGWEATAHAHHHLHGGDEGHEHGGDAGHVQGHGGGSSHADAAEHTKGHASEVHAQGDGRAHAPPGEIPPDSQGPSVDDSDSEQAHRHEVVRAVPATDGEDA